MKQKGGIRVTLNREAIRNGLAQTPLPSPSQKRDVCTTDAFATIIWYTDELRQPFWRWLFQGGDTVTIDTNEELERLTNQSTREEVVRGWLRTTGARIGNILSRQDILVPASFGLGLKRSESSKDIVSQTSTSTSMTDSTPEVSPEAEKCARFYHLYRAREREEETTVEDIAAKTSYRIASDLVPSMMNVSLAMVGAHDTFGCGVEPIMPSGAIPLAILFDISASEDRGGHTVAVCRVNGRWFFFDNEAGIASPLLQQEFDMTQNFKIEYHVISGTVLFQLLLVDGTVLSKVNTRIKPTEMPNQSVTYTEFPSLRRRRVYFYRRPEPEIEALSTQLEQLKLETPPKKQRPGILEDVKLMMKRRRQGGKRKTIRKLKRKSKQTRRR